MVKILHKTLAVASVAALLLAGCSAADQKKADSAAGGTVTVVTHDSFHVDKADLKRFTEKTGLKVKTVPAGDGTVINNLRLNKDHPTADAFFGIDSFQAADVIKENLASEYVPAGFESEFIVDKKLTPIDRGDVCLNTDKAWFKKKGLAEPAGFEDLLKPEYKGTTVLTDPKTSTPGFAFLAATVAKFGDDGWQKYWKDLLANGAKVDDGWENAYNVDFSAGDGKGAYPVVLSYSSSPAYAKGATNSVNSTCVTQIEYAGVVKGAKNAEGAKKFIDFLVSKDVQKTIPDQMYVYPILKDVKLPEDWAKYAPLPEKTVPVDMKKAAENREAWLKAWSEIYKGAAK
ncbi:hypothetical protein HMPREF1631_05095 [Arcanobacterium sp. S3PF19]|nr:hypothetical protein HMPREF1631_05095 [Arcanobacterium sp. S3PF19]